MQLKELSAPISGAVAGAAPRRTVLPFAVDLAAPAGPAGRAPDPTAIMNAFRRLQDSSNERPGPFSAPPLQLQRRQPSPRLEALRQNGIVETADRGADLLRRVEQGIVSADRALADFNAEVNRSPFSAHARSRLQADFSAGVLRLERRDRPTALRTQRVHPQFPLPNRVVGQTPATPLPIPRHPSSNRNVDESRNNEVAQPTATLRAAERPGSRSQEDRRTPDSMAFEARTGFSIRRIDPDTAFTMLSNELEGRAELLSRFSDTLEGRGRDPASEHARSVVEQHVEAFWHLFVIAGADADNDLQRALAHDIGTILGGQVVLYTDGGLPDAARIYGALSPALRTDLINGVASGISDGQKGLLSGVLDTATNAFAQRTVPEAIAILRQRHSSLRSRERSYAKSRQRTQRAENGFSDINRVLVSDSHEFKVAKISYTSKGIRVARLPHDRYPGSVEHIIDARKAGVPTQWTFCPGPSASRRSIAQKGHERVSGRDLDEVPFASVAEGGANASIRALLPSDNRGAGSFIRRELGDIKPGEKFVVIPVDTVPRKRR